MESNKLNTRLSLVGALLGLTLFIMGGLLNTILDRYIIIIPAVTIVISLISLIKSKKTDIKIKSYSSLGLILGLFYFILSLYELLKL
ncbi:hypothetical protein C1H57_09290 [Clostridium sp. 2-1]|uniref:Protein tyrosine/serine phosphatase n=2 Tax=Clostridium TaxID=1485 RepID=A0AAX0BB27_CLOBE|nr:MULTISPECIES: hypothetical protein [Clostridium]MBN7575458.1 hypothetical protein [Clostridium beijerinckii]MBN7580828.1 hypothetical protein [Clostridium beijerinckii]MBN7585222.1 hypothetical protein [Clostridium beijerinckii]MBO0521022.1 hypothetical protein [Clostridium beijerinckii]NOW07999.1 protein tyrosine/serine phosphatase [Clostridium beijerinckii]